MGTLANSERPDEMPHKAAFYQSPESALFAKINQSSEKEIQFFFKIITCDP